VRACVIVTHPHIKLDGDRRNKLVEAVARFLVEEAGFTVLTFDFRGAGGSSGSATLSGSDERADLVRARFRIALAVPWRARSL
jgi:alpha/beta superfamily hydrolase